MLGLEVVGGSDTPQLEYNATPRVRAKITPPNVIAPSVVLRLFVVTQKVIMMGCVGAAGLNVFHELSEV